MQCKALQIKTNANATLLLGFAIIPIHPSSNYSLFGLEANVTSHHSLLWQLKLRDIWEFFPTRGFYPISKACVVTNISFVFELLT